MAGKSDLLHSRCLRVLDIAASLLFACAVAAQGAYPCADNIKGRWYMDVTNNPTPDSSGNTNHGVFTGTNIIWTNSAKYGGGFFLGTATAADNGYFACGSDSSVSITGKGIAVSAWINPSTQSRTWMGVISKVDGNFVSGGYCLYLYNSEIRFFINNYNSYQASITSNLLDGAWHHVVGTYDGTNVCVYVDKKRAAVGYTGNIINYATEARVGKAHGGYNFYGFVDEAVIWNRALTSNEVTDLYNLVKDPPSSFSLVAPADSATNVDLWVTLDWGTATGATYYIVYFGTNSTPALYTNGLTATDLNITGLAGETAYYWYVIATNDNGYSRAPATGTWSFITGTPAPKEFSLQSPADVATAVSTSPTLSWNGATNAESYALHLGLSTNPAQYGTNVGPTALAVTNLVSGAQYYWYVVATNAYGASRAPASGAWSFTTMKAHAMPRASNIQGRWYMNVTNNPTPDSSGYTNHGFFVSTNLVWTNAAKYDGGFTLGGSNTASEGYFSCGSTTNLSITGKGIAVSAWIKPSTQSRTWMGVVSKTDNSFSSGYCLYLYSDSSVRFFVNNYLSYQASFITNLLDGAWHHVVGTYDGTNVSVYVDTKQASVAYTNDIVNYATDARIGKAHGGYNFYGAIDETIVWNCALTSNEVNELYYLTADWPSSFAQISPADGATNVELWAELDWQDATNASKYYAYLATNAEPGLYAGDLVASAVTLSGMTGNSTYYWYVVASNSFGTSRAPATGTWTFVTGNPDLIAPVITAVFPTNNALTNVAPETIQITFVETHSGLDVAGSVHTVTTNSIGITGVWSTNADLLIFTPDDPLEDGQYDIYAVLRDVAGNTGGVFTSSFTIDQTPPATPVIAPVTSPTEINIQTIAGTKEANTAVDRNGAQVVALGSATNWTDNLSFTTSGWYSCDYRARDAAGNLSAVTNVSIFYTNTPPGPVTLTAQVYGDGTRITLAWTNYSEYTNGNDIAGYRVFGSDSDFDDASTAQLIGTNPPGSKTFVVTGLTAGVTRYYAALAFDTAGQADSNVTALAAAPVFTTYPPWWIARGVVNTSSAPKDYAAANLGQVKQIAMQAWLELEELPGGAGFTLDFGNSNNYAAVNLGQLKNLAINFYNRLLMDYPWLDATNTNDYAVANIGQVKNLFAFDPDEDDDLDNLPDWWELHWYGDLTTVDGSTDTDGDGLPAAEEYFYGTNPTDSDSDDDGLNDGQEIAAGCDPLDSDSDDDGLNDGQEVLTYGSNPNLADSDGDGYTDYDEVVNRHTNPNNPDQTPPVVVIVEPPNFARKVWVP